MNEMPECSNQTHRKAIKSHRCTSCGADIAKGVKYLYVGGIWGGTPQSFKVCEECETVMNNFKNIDEHLCWEDGPSLDFGGVSAWMQGFLCSSWRGDEAAKDMAAIFGVSIDYARRQLGLQRPDK